MSADWLTAIATAGTFVVIALSALAALLQLRHIRGSNQIAVFIEVRERIESPEFEAASIFCRIELPKRLAANPQLRKALLSPQESEEATNIRKVANFFESLGAFVKRGVIDRDLACDVWGSVVLRNWTSLEPIITSRRAAHQNDRLLENFEYLAALSQQWIQTHPQGTYPVNVPRMERSAPWPEAAQ